MVYLIVGSNEHLINERINKIVKKDSDIIYFKDDYNMEDVIKEARYGSLFEVPKYLIVYEYNLFSAKKEETNDKDNDLLINYLNNQNESNNIIFVNKTIDLRKKIVKLIKEKYELINIEKIDYQNIRTFINEYVEKNNYQIDYQSVNYLINLWGLNFDIICHELDKAMLYNLDLKKINYNDIKDIISKPYDDNNFHFVDAVVNKRIDDAFKLYQELKINKIDSNVLVILLAREYRLIYYVKKASGEGKNNQDIESYLNMQEWQISKLYKEGLNYSYKEIESKLLELAKIDELIKTGILNKDICLNNFLLNII